MPTVKDVIYKVVKKQNVALAEYYLAYREESKIENDMQVKKLFQEEAIFWATEIDTLHIPSKMRKILYQKLREALSSRDYINVFENDIAPVIALYWRF